MKPLHLIRSLFAATFVLLLACSPVLAQWQVPNYAVPLGRGAGTGFKSAAPGTAGCPLASAGASADPTFSCAITPTWTGLHTFNAGVTIASNNALTIAAGASSKIDLSNSTTIFRSTSDGSLTFTSQSGTLVGVAYNGTSSSTNALAIGRQGTTSPAFQVDASASSSATGLKVTAAAAAGGVAVAAISSGTNENLTLDAKGSGTITLGGTSTGAITLTRATTMSAALTYGGVTLSNGVTGTGSMVLSASAALTGSPTAPTQTLQDNSTKIATTAYVDTSTREKLTASRTYYVRTDGSDSNTGLANTSGGAFLTIQKAINVVAALDIQTYSVTINVAAGTYTAGVSVTAPWLGNGTVQLTGDTTTPSNVVISTTSADAISVTTGGRLSVAGFKLVTTTAGTGVVAAYGGAIAINGNMEYGACATAHIRSLDGGRITFTAYTVSGNSPLHYDANGAGSSIRGQGVGTITISGTPAFSTAFARALSGGVLTANANTYSGSATGTRYSVTLNAVINTAGGGANYFPGDAAGSTATGGQYA